MYQDLLLTQQNEVLLITINRPDVRNALRRNSYAELERAIRECTARCIVITGADPAFCAGDDIREFMGNGELQEYLEQETTLYSFTEALLYTDIPIIAAINGVAVGWGMELSLAADIRIASERARFSEAFVARGLLSDVPGLGLLSKIVGREHAARLLFTGEMIDAPKAAAIGLVSEVVSHDDVISRALDLAQTIAANPPLAVRSLKEGLRRALDPDWREFGVWLRRTQAELSRTKDHEESIRALVEKRQPHFVEE